MKKVKIIDILCYAYQYNIQKKKKFAKKKKNNNNRGDIERKKSQ